MELQVEGRHAEIRKSWQAKIEVEKDRLIRHHAGLVQNLRVAIEATSNHKEGGYEVRLIAAVPDDIVVVKRKGESVKPLLVKAFDNLDMQLKEMQRKRKQSQKTSEPQNPAQRNGTVKTISPIESFGFILLAGGKEVYFHENALKDIGIDKLSVGDEVVFGEAEGDKGPCASWVRMAK
ncbi:MAG: cold shock domain-containing protein [Desulfobulbales bacterium]|nr:cold shock domain-containing protein [Desulfobulbales bacterium]